MDLTQPLTADQMLLAWLIGIGLIVGAVVAIRRGAPRSRWPVPILAGLAVQVPSIGLLQILLGSSYPEILPWVLVLGLLALTLAVPIAAGGYLGSLRGDIPRYRGLVLGFAIGAVLLPILDRFGEPVANSDSCFGSCTSWYGVFYWIHLGIRSWIGLLPAMVACAVATWVRRRRDRHAERVLPPIEGGVQAD